MYQILVLLWKMVHAFDLANNYCVRNMNNPIQYEPVGHLAASFAANAATRGENGDLFLWNLVISAPYYADNHHAISLNKCYLYIFVYVDLYKCLKWTINIDTLRELLLEST